MDECSTESFTQQSKAFGAAHDESTGLGTVQIDYYNGIDVSVAAHESFELWVRPDCTGSEVLQGNVDTDLVFQETKADGSACSRNFWTASADVDLH